MTPQELIQQLIEHGGGIVSSNDCCPMEIADARATGRFAVDDNGFGFVRRTAEWLALQKSREEKSREGIITKEDVDLMPESGFCGSLLR